MVARKSNPLILILGGAILFGCGKKAEVFETPLAEARDLLSARDFAGAESKCKELLAKDPKDLNSMLLLVEIFEKQGKIEQAVETCSDAIRIAPQDWRAFQERSDLQLLLADKALTETERWQLQDLAVADMNVVAELNPDAAAAYSKVATDSPKILERPVAKYEEPDEPYEVIDSFKKQQKSGEDLAAQKKQGEGDPDEASEESEEPPSNVETASDYAARISREAEKIREKELAEELQDPVLPLHLDPIAEPLPQLPEAPVTRFGLPTRDDGSLLLPNLRGSVATGIRPSSEISEERADEEENTGPRNRFFLQNQFGSNQQGIRTGIGRSKSTTRPTNANRSASTQWQSGFLPPGARGTFGPRLGVRPEGAGDDRSTDSPRDGVNPPQSTVASPILTTALPGTAIEYGIPTQSPRTGNATLSNARNAGSTGTGRNPSSPSRFGTLSDPNFTPFGKRPSTSSTPRLPPVRTSN